MLAGILTVLSGNAIAHDPGLSAVDVRVLGDRIVAEVSFSALDLQGVQVEQSLLRLDDRQGPIALRSIRRESSDQNSVHFVVEFSTANVTELRITTLVLDRLPRGHKQFCTVYDRNNQVLAERLLTAEANNFTLNLETTRAGNKSIVSFLVLGVEHILTGYDHLAFLLALLLAGGSLRSNVKIITSFTVAHSLTLALATFGLISIPSVIVEPVIAASIVFVGIENLVRRRLAARWLITFAFGLVHGLGFWSALRDLGIGATGAGAFVGATGADAFAGVQAVTGAQAAIPLLSFNLGVELAQIAIAALVLPVIWKLEQRPSFTLRHVPALSLLITLAGLYWLIARTLM